MFVGQFAEVGLELAAYSDFDRVCEPCRRLVTPREEAREVEQTMLQLLQQPAHVGFTNVLCLALRNLTQRL